MGQKLALLAGAALGAALATLLGRRRRPAAQPPAGMRAERLRQKLDEAKSAASEGEPAPESAPTGQAIAEPEPAPDEIEQERRRVHAEGRATADEMRRSGGSTSGSEPPSG